MNDLHANFVKLKREESIKEKTIDYAALKVEMDRTFKHGKPKGEPTHFHPIDSGRIFTWKKGFLYCFTGNPQSGKSEMLNFLTMLRAIKNKETWTVYSPESYPVMDFLDTLCHVYVGKSTDPSYKNQMSSMEYDRAFEFIIRHYKIIDFNQMPSIDDVIEADSKKKTDGLIIDPFNSLDEEGKDFYEYLKHGLTKLKKYAADNNKYVICVEHPKSEGSLDKEGNPREPNQFTLNGGKMWDNKCDVIAVVHRPLLFTEPQATQVTLRTRKVKNQKLNGFQGLAEFNFDRAMNRYFYLQGDGPKTGFEKPEQQRKANF